MYETQTTETPWNCTHFMYFCNFCKTNNVAKTDHNFVKLTKFYPIQQSWIRLCKNTFGTAHNSIQSHNQIRSSKYNLNTDRIANNFWCIAIFTKPMMSQKLTPQFWITLQRWTQLQSHKIVHPIPQNQIRSWKKKQWDCSIQRTFHKSSNIITKLNTKLCEKRCHTIQQIKSDWASTIRIGWKCQQLHLVFHHFCKTNDVAKIHHTMLEKMRFHPIQHNQSNAEMRLECTPNLFFQMEPN